MRNRISFCKTLLLIMFLSPSLTVLQAQSEKLKVIELRNYLIKPGQREHYIEYFETKLIDTLNAMDHFVLGQYTVHGAPDNFLWIRGFEDMEARTEGYEAFYGSNFWQTHSSFPLENIINYDNVYLLKPVNIQTGETDSPTSFDMDWFGKPKGITVVDFYKAKEKRSQLIEFIDTTYDSLRKASGVKDISYWIHQPTSEGNIPSCDDKDLLVTISFYRNEPEYKTVMDKLNKIMEQETKNKMLGIVTTKTTWVLHPTNRSFSTANK